MDLPQQGVEILDVMDGQGADHQIERALQRRQIVHAHAQKTDVGELILPGGDRQHFLRNIDPHHVRRPTAGKFPAIFPISASQVDDGFARHIRKQGKQRRLFHEVVRSGRILPQLLISVEKKDGSS